MILGLGLRLFCSFRCMVSGLGDMLRSSERMHSAESMSMEEKLLNPSLKLAIAMAVLRARRHATNLSQKIGSTSTTAVSEPVIDSDVHHWKRKAKERKVQLIKMREDLKEAEDALRHDVFTHNSPCKCFFFNELGKSSVVMVRDDFDDTFNDVLHRRFLRQVRLNERKRRKHDGLISRWRPSVTNVESDEEKLRAAVDFLVNLCDNTSCARMGEDHFANWVHQAVDFIVSLKITMPSGKNNDAIQVTVNSLITYLFRRMCFPLKKNDLYDDGANAQFYIQHLIRKLGSNLILGHHTMLLVCERISTFGESLLFMDPLDDSFVDIHSSMFLLMELIEFLVLDYVGTCWSDGKDSTKVMEEEWVASVIHTRDGLKMTESRNSLYVHYMDRVVGLLGRKLGHLL